MNCDECKEQVLALIEREAVDPEGVRQILARCPDCREVFDRMKAALALAAELPLEEPSAGIDEAILRAAAARVPKVVPLRRRRLQPPPWAMAAVALLAVGVGVWAIPRGVQLEGDPGQPAATNVEEAIVAEVAPDEDVELEDVVAEKEPAEPPPRQAARLRTAERPEAKARPAAAKRRFNAPTDAPKAGVMAEATVAAPASDIAAGARAKARSGEADYTESRARKKERADEATATCRRKIDEIERRARDDEDYVPTPEEKLATGKCYQTLGELAEARKWFRRAAAHPETRARAEKALGELAPE
jgi:hypothetical protein